MGRSGREPLGRRILALLALAVSAWLALPLPISAQATPPVPLEDPSYSVLDRVAAQLPTANLIHGQRPYTRLEFARLTRELRAALDELERSPAPPSDARARWLRGLLDALEERYRDEVGWLGGEGPEGARVHADALRLDGTVADSPFRGFTWNGLGSADNAQVNPLLDNRHGLELVDGFTGGIEAWPRVQLGPYGAVFGGVRVAHLDPRSDDDTDVDVSLRSGAVRGKLGSWALQVGRAPIRRGQGRDAGVLFSDNGPALDMVALQNEELFRIPLVHRLLGPARLTLSFADLGREQNFPHAKLYSNWLTFRPARRLEVGGGFVVQDGGEGGPEQSIWRRIGDYLIFVDVLFQTGSDFTASNKIAGVDFRLALPEVGAALYGELYVDDFRVFNWSHVREMLWPDAAHVFGLELPRLDGVGRLSGWAEYHHTGIRIYRHYAFSSGLTRGRFLLGNALGSDAHAVLGGFDFTPSSSSSLALEAAWERRRHHGWLAPEEPFFHFEMVEALPVERRRRVELSWAYHPFARPIGWRVEAGAERVVNFGFEEGAEETNAALRFVLEWRPR